MSPAQSMLHFDVKNVLSSTIQASGFCFILLLHLSQCTAVAFDHPAPPPPRPPPQNSQTLIEYINKTT